MKSIQRITKTGTYCLPRTDVVYLGLAYSSRRIRSGSHSFENESFHDYSNIKLHTIQFAHKGSTDQESAMAQTNTNTYRVNGSETTDLTLPVMRLFETVLAQAICATDQSESDEITTTLSVHECLLNLLLRSHHEWTVLHDVLVEWLSRDLMSIHHQPSDSSDHANDPHQDEIGITLQSVDGDARLLTVSRQNERVERLVGCARVANSNLPIHRCER